MRRTQTAETPGDDFKTWDLKRLFAEIGKQFNGALSAADALKKVPVKDYDVLLEKGNMPDAYRPTLYDFIAHEALAFYASGEQAGARASDAFDLSAESPIFGAAVDFMNWDIQTEDADSPTVKALRLYQALFQFHYEDGDNTPWLDVDLARLRFGYNKAFGETKKARYKAALKNFAEDNKKHPLSSHGLSQLAGVLREEKKMVEAHGVATQGKTRFPDSNGGKLCHNIIQQIEAKAIRIGTERVWNKPLSSIDIRYRNLTRVFFRIVPYDGKDWVREPRWLSRDERDRMLARAPVLSWSLDLPPTPDYQERLEETPIREDLKSGAYLLIASCNEAFNDQDNQVLFTPFWQSRLALVVRRDRFKGELSGFVLDAQSGRPLADAQVEAWGRQGRNWASGGKARTDDAGLFRFKHLSRNSYLIKAAFEDQVLTSGNDHYIRKDRNDPRPSTRTVFFTDRALYRPGQTIRYKGICLDVFADRDSYKVLSGKNLTVIFSDRNGKEIATQNHRTNDYGSFNGSFTAPRDRLMGRMRIAVKGNPRGSVSVQVEEYKRPKFKVALEAPADPARLNGKVTLRGSAMAYTGAAIGGAKVKWRVVRQVRYPPWWGWYYWWRRPQSNSQEIAHGAASTGADGFFDVTFTALPDRSVSEKDEPIFQYSVHADVTDTAGETRSAQRAVNVGYTALQASLQADDWQTVNKPVGLRIRTTSLDGEGRQAEGVVKVYRLVQTDKVLRARLTSYRWYGFSSGATAPKPDPANIESWKLGTLVEERGFTTDPEGGKTAHFQLEAGPYRAVLTTQDRFGKAVTARLTLQVLDAEADRMPIRLADLFKAPVWSVEPGETFMALWGSGYDQARAYVEIEHRHKILQSYWTDASATQAVIKQEVTEAMRGGFTVRVTFVRENRAYLHTRKVNVPWTSKDLSIKWERFVSKLKPGAQETWTATITGPKAEKAVAELVATLYDASLDAFKRHGWPAHFNVFRQDRSRLSSQFENRRHDLRHILGGWARNMHSVRIQYRHYPRELTRSLWGYGFGPDPTMSGISVDNAAVARNGAPMAPSEAPPTAKGMAFGNADGEEMESKSVESAEDRGGGGAAGQGKPPAPDLSQVAARKNLNETAFFFPHLMSDKSGEVKLQFTMPEALTEWRFFGFAHDAELRAGFLSATAVTAKDLMVQPNPPRFMREGDALHFTVKVSNQSAARQAGTVRLTFADARTGECVDAQIGNAKTDLPFDVPSKESRTLAWSLKVPDGMGFLTYKAVGSTGRLSDGEEGFLPVLSRRIFVTESLPLPIRGKATKKFAFKKLIESAQSDTLQHKTLTVQMVSNPAWYAVMALPYLMEYPHQCSEQIFNRFYANGLARFIARSDPKIRRVFDQWKGTPALDSPLEKNQDLKAVMIEETPWYRQARSESQARRNVGVLFDDNRLKDEIGRAFRELSERQLPDGAWPWFPGGRGNDYITLYITTGFGRLRHLGLDVDVTPARKALKRLDGWINKIYQRILERGNKDKYHLSPTIAFYLYGRSFFLKDQGIDVRHKAAVDYFLGQAREYWLKLANRQSQAHLALALKRFGEDAVTPRAIMRSIKERSVSDEEMGLFWRELEYSWWWYRAPIETQAMMIEAFDEVMGDARAVEDLKVWLLKQKQTQDWKTTKATADAVYALLLRGTDLLASDALVGVTLDDLLVKPEKVEAGTGFYEKRFVGPEVKPEYGRVTVQKVDDGVAWGSLHWQYLEDMSKVTPYEGTPLKLDKKLFIREYTGKGPMLKAVKGALQPGDELVVRLVLRVDRDMEYVHLKDQRGSGTEPVNVLSRYKFQDGLYYYESTRDTASHFFIDYLPKGTYVFEYATRVVHKGRYQTGMAQIQCMYAPEFNSHSESFVLTVE